MIKSIVMNDKNEKYFILGLDKSDMLNLLTGKPLLCIKPSELYNADAFIIIGRDTSEDIVNAIQKCVYPQEKEFNLKDLTIET